MKSYRFLARAGGYLFKTELEALNDEEAQNVFVKCIEEGKYECAQEGTVRKELLLVTYEELNGNRTELTGSKNG
jgi:hypothetical protein